VKVSLICTVLNEEASVEAFLDSLSSQSRLPDEVVIVDGGSTDKTVEIINTYVADGIPIRLIIAEGANISQGRNIAIRNSTYDYIAGTDAGVRLDKDWLNNLLDVFGRIQQAEVVVGFYLPEPRTRYERYVCQLLYPEPEWVDLDKFFPSSRSIAFHKKCWKKVGGYPEWLYTGEDGLFAVRMREAGCKFGFAKDAIAYWRPRPNLRALYKQYYLYAKGSAKAGTAGLGAKYNMGTLKRIFSHRLPLFLRKNLLLEKKLSCLWLGPVILLTAIFGVAMGTLAGKWPGEVRKSMRDDVT
jgi:glycosyltransferase involved in cell wall biosynthesis